MRVIGLVVGALFLLAVMRHLRKKKEDRSNLLLPVFFGTGVVIVSIFPEVASFPANILTLRDIAGGRLITLLLISSCFLWVLLLWERAKSSHVKLQLQKIGVACGVNNFSCDMSLNPGALWVVIPVLNEADNLRELLPKIPKTLSGRDVHVLVVDDGSIDDSAVIAQECGCLVASMLVNFGGGLALKTGFEIASRHGASVIVTIDGDCQHDPADIGKVVSPIFEGEADLVIGSRQLGSYDKVSTIRSVGLHVFNRTINLLQGTQITDCASGFRGIRLDSLRKWRLYQEQYHTAEMIIEAAKAGATITEVPITVQNRSHGESKKGKDFLYGFFFLRTVLKAWFK
jgi:hypothetical protein